MPTYEAQLQAALLAKFAQMGYKTIQGAAIEALTAGDLQLLMDALDFAEFVGDINEITDILTRVGGRSGNRSLEQIATRRLTHAGERIGVSTQGEIGIAFSVVDQNSARWAQQRAAQLVVEIADDMRSTIREVVVDSLNGGYTTQEAARQLARVIPLHSRYARAVVRRESKLYLEGIRNGLTPRAAAQRAERMGATYADKLVRARARTIARTEVMTASNVGQHIGYQSAIDGGLLSNPGSGYKVLVKEWVTAEDERVCPVCGPKDKVTVDWAEAFPGGFIIPPAHPNCRCSFNLIDTRDQADFDGMGTAEQEYAELVAA